MDTIPGVPESIRLSALRRMLAVVGLDPDGLVSLHMDCEGITAVVPATDETGLALPTADGEGFARHRVFIKMEHD